MVIQIIGAFLGKVNILFIKGFYFFYISQFCFLFFGESDERFPKSCRCWNFPPPQGRKQRRVRKDAPHIEKLRDPYLMTKL